MLSASWADLGEDKSPFMSKQGAMRALAALAHASLTSRPGEGLPVFIMASDCQDSPPMPYNPLPHAGDPTYVGGLLLTLESLLDSLDSIRAKQKSSLAGFLAARGGEGGGGSSGGAAPAGAAGGGKKKSALAVRSGLVVAVCRDLESLFIDPW